MVKKTKMILPEIFIRRMMKILDQEFDIFQQSFDNEISTSIRTNPAKYKGQPVLIPVEYCETGYFVQERPLFTLDPFFHSGVYYVQESSSMFLEQAIKQLTLKSDLKVLDLCGAPGGKSTHLASLLPKDSLLVSNDVIRVRSQILSENLKKWGNTNVIVTNNDPRDFQRLPQFFDLVVIDAPCSGEGLFRRDANATLEWSPDNAQLCAQRQQRILADIWPTLKEGGILIYSTCTFNPAENEENIQWLRKFASVEPVILKIADHWGITLTNAGGIPCYRFYPHKVSGEGFFMAVVRKVGGGSDQLPRRIKENPLLASKGEKVMVKELFINEGLDILRFEDSLLAFPSHLISELILIKSNLRILHAGVKIGEIKQKDFLPAHELALSTILNRSAYPGINLPIEEALTYLKREVISPPFANKGWNLITYRNIPLGWVKNLGNRYNSAFPKEWRIRMSVSEFRGERLMDEMARFPL
jgi:16S rRNA C967 or C1407 C5-methylase (RsmB/RsmF family)/NOL1/NOP2/fmu family ribosome biogenesis protein